MEEVRSSQMFDRILNMPLGILSFDLDEKLLDIFVKYSDLFYR